MGVENPITTENTAMKIFAIDRESLTKCGLGKEAQDKLYKSFYVYSSGIHDAIRQATLSSHPESKNLALKSWSIFTRLLEFCEPNTTEMIFQEMQRNQHEVIKKMTTTYDEALSTKQAECEDVNKQVVMLKLRSESAEHQLEDLTKTHVSVTTSLRRTIADSEKELDTTRKRDEVLVTDIREAKKTNSKLFKEVTDLSAQVAQQKIELEAAAQAHTLAKAKINGLSNKVAQGESRMEQDEITIQKLREQQQHQLADRQHLFKQMSEQGQELRTSVTTNKQLAAEVEELTRQRTTWQQRIFEPMKARVRSIVDQYWELSAAYSALYELGVGGVEAEVERGRRHQGVLSDGHTVHCVCPSAEGIPYPETATTGERVAQVAHVVGSCRHFETLSEEVDNSDEGMVRKMYVALRSREQQEKREEAMRNRPLTTCYHGEYVDAGAEMCCWVDCAADSDIAPNLDADTGEPNNSLKFVEAAIVTHNREFVAATRPQLAAQMQRLLDDHALLPRVQRELRRACFDSRAAELQSELWTELNTEQCAAFNELLYEYENVYKTGEQTRKDMYKTQLDFAQFRTEAAAREEALNHHLEAREKELSTTISEISKLCDKYAAENAILSSNKEFVSLQQRFATLTELQSDTAQELKELKGDSSARIADLEGSIHTLKGDMADAQGGFDVTNTANEAEIASLRDQLTVTRAELATVIGYVETQKVLLYDLLGEFSAHHVVLQDLDQHLAGQKRAIDVETKQASTGDYVPPGEAVVVESGSRTGSPEPVERAAPTSPSAAAESPVRPSIVSAGMSLELFELPPYKTPVACVIASRPNSAAKFNINMFRRNLDGFRVKASEGKALLRADIPRLVNWAQKWVSLAVDASRLARELFDFQSYFRRERLMITHRFNAKVKEARDSVEEATKSKYQAIVQDLVINLNKHKAIVATQQQKRLTQMAALQSKRARREEAEAGGGLGEESSEFTADDSQILDEGSLESVLGVCLPPDATVETPHTAQRKRPKCWSAGSASEMKIEEKVAAAVLTLPPSHGGSDRLHSRRDSGAGIASDESDGTVPADSTEGVDGPPAADLECKSVSIAGSGLESPALAQLSMVEQEVLLSAVMSVAADICQQQEEEGLGATGGRDAATPTTLHSQSRPRSLLTSRPSSRSESKASSRVLSQPVSNPSSRPISRGSDSPVIEGPALCSSNSGHLPALSGMPPPTDTDTSAAGANTRGDTAFPVLRSGSGDGIGPALGAAVPNEQSGTSSTGPVYASAHKENEAQSIVNVYRDLAGGSIYGVKSMSMSKPAPPAVTVEETVDSTVTEEIGRRKNDRSSFMAKHRTHIVSKCQSLSISSSTAACDTVTAGIASDVSDDEEEQSAVATGGGVAPTVHVA